MSKYLEESYEVALRDNIQLMEENKRLQAEIDQYRKNLDKAHVLLDKYETMLNTEDDGYIICPNCGRVKAD